MKRLVLATSIFILLTSSVLAANFPSLPNTFSALQLISSAKINSNFNALKNGIIDGTKKLNMNELWINGVLVSDSQRNITTNRSYSSSFVGNGSGLTGIPSFITGNAAYGAGSGAPTNSVYITATTGNIGIGTTSPSQKLHVSGNVIVSGSINLNSNLEIHPQIAVSSNVLQKSLMVSQWGIRSDGGAITIDATNGQTGDLNVVGTLLVTNAQDSNQNVRSTGVHFISFRSLTNDVSTENIKSQTGQLGGFVYHISISSDNEIRIQNNGGNISRMYATFIGQGS